jgi:hypothetical protein
MEISLGGNKFVVSLSSAETDKKRTRTEEPAASPPIDPTTYSVPASWTHPSFAVRSAIEQFKTKTPFGRVQVAREALGLKEANERQIGEYFRPSSALSNWLVDKPDAARAWRMISDTDVKRFLSAAFKELHDINVPVDGDSNKIPREKLYSGVVLVPTGNDNDHNYELGVPIVSSGMDSYFYRFGSKSEKGNQLTKTISNLRLPTFEEYIAVVVSRS